MYVCGNGQLTPKDIGVNPCDNLSQLSDMKNESKSNYRCH